MKNNQNRPIGNEYRASQVYKTLTGSGIPVANKIAEGLGKAAEGIDSALSGISPTMKKSNPYYRNYTQGPQNGPSPVQPQGGPGGVYQYQHSPNNKNQVPQWTPGQGRTSQTAGSVRQGQPPRQGQPVGQAQPPIQTQPGGYPQGHAAPTRGPVFYGHHVPVKPNGVNPAPPPRMKVVRRGSSAKFYITGAAAFLYALNFPMYELMHFGIFAIAMVMVFLISGAIFKGKKEFVPIEETKVKEEPAKKPEPRVEKKADTGNPEVDKIIDEGSGYIKKLKAMNDAIPDENLSACIHRMERSSADIFRYISEHPEKAQQIRKFMNYYLPTTLKLLDSYHRLSSQSVKGENITSTLFNISGMMSTVADAFEKQLDSLYADEAMDISADITVFETMLKQEGFVEEKK